MNPKIKTKFGTAKLNKQGYYQITTRGEGNNKKYLHRLIYEDFYGVSLLPTTVIHHIDGNTLNNCILNLQMVSKSTHNSIHKSGERCSFYGKHFVGELNGMYGKKHSLESRKKISKCLNTTGYYRVCKHKKKALKQGFTYVYGYIDDEGNRKELSSIDLDKLKEKVLAKGLEWIKFERGSHDTTNN